jgi:hypothetical protein
LRETGNFWNTLEDNQREKALLEHSRRSLEILEAGRTGNSSNHGSRNLTHPRTRWVDSRAKRRNGWVTANYYGPANRDAATTCSAGPTCLPTTTATRSLSS